MLNLECPQARELKRVDFWRYFKGRDIERCGKKEEKRIMEQKCLHVVGNGVGGQGRREHGRDG